MTTARPHARVSPPRAVFDLALTETINAAINAARDALRAEAALKAATLTGNEVRLSDARHALNNANAEVAITRSNLSAAIALEAEARL